MTIPREETASTSVVVVCAMERLENATLVHILSFLSPKDMVKVAKICKKLREVEASRPVNQIWWGLCMRKWYVQEEAVKQKKPAGIHKTNWKRMYFSIGGDQDTYAPIPKKEDQKKNTKQPVITKEDKWAEEEAPATKEEMRMAYKQIRSKPKNKRPTHTQRAFDYM